MPDKSSEEILKSLEKLIRQAPPPEWVRQMVDFYRRHGAYRPQDLRRLLGDPKRGVGGDLRESVCSHFCDR